MAKNKALQAIVEIAGTLSPTLGKSIDEATGKLEKVNVKALAVGAAVGGIAIAGGKAVLEAGKYLNDLGTEYQNAINDLSAATGATGEELEGLGDVVKEVYGNNFGESMQDAAEGVAKVMQVTDLAGEELQKATEAAFALSDTFGFEIEESTRSASAMMKNFGLDAEEAYNLIAYGAQNGANQNGDLLDTLNEYSAQYDALGLSADQFVEGLVTAGDMGVFSIDKVGDAVKEFNIRSKDLSDSSAEAYKSLGMDADEMFKRFSAGGETANAAFFEVVGALEGMDDPLKKNEAAVALFGTMYEDLGDDILPILSSMEVATLDNVDALGQINEVKYDNIGEAFESIKRSAEVSLLPLATTLANGLKDLMPIITDTFELLGPIIEDTVEMAMPFVEDFLAQAGTILQQVMPLLAELVSNVLPFFIQLLDTLLPPAMQIIEAILPVLVELLNAIMPILNVVLMLLSPILDLIVALLEPIMGLITSAVVPLIEVLGSLINTALTPLIPLIEWVSGILTGVLGSAIEAVRPIIDSLTQVFSGLIDFITNVFAGNWSGAWESIVGIFGSIFDGIKALFKAPINFIIEGINSFLGGINKIKIPDWVPGIGGKGINIPLIPKLAEGGFTEGLSIAGEAGTEAVISFDPSVRKNNIEYWQQAGQLLGVLPSKNDGQTIADILANLPAFADGGFTNGLSIAGEAGTEAVISFDPARRQENIGYWAAAGRLLGLEDFSLSEMNENSTVIIYDFSGFTWSPVISNSSEEPQRDERLLAKLKAHEAEFFDWLEEWLRSREVGKYATHSFVY